MCTPGVALVTKFMSVLSADPMTEILTANKVALPKDMGMYWSVVADLFACSGEDDEGMSC